jgi:magnesium and cobalt exporter, CNNM family
VTVRLPADPADLVADEPPPPTYLDVEVRAIDKHVPSALFATVHTDRKDAVDE